MTSMKKLITLITCCMLLAGINKVQAQMGKLKSVAGSALDKKSGEKKSEKETADTAKTNNTQAKPETKEVKKEAAPLGKYSDIKANMTDANLEKQALDLVNEKATNEKWNEKYTKAKIVSKDWEVVKNEITGAVLKRKIYMSLYGVWPNGKCKSVGFGFFQDYDGNKFSSNLQYNSIGDMKQVECE
jgi:hypothetical protein